MRKVFWPLFIAILCLFLSSCEYKIDREALVRRHIPWVANADFLSPFTVGNGEFAFTADITGLQTFSEDYKKIPLGTQSHWGWHSVPNRNNFTLDQTFHDYDSHGRNVAYASLQNSEAGQYFRANPHRLHLGSIGFHITQPDGSLITLNDIHDIHQSEDLWEGIIKSSFRVNNKKVKVQTACHGEIDQVGVKIESELLSTGRVGIRFAFPYGSTEWGRNGADWTRPERHSSELVTRGDNSALIKRTLDETQYFVQVNWKGRGELETKDDHTFILFINNPDTFEFTCAFYEIELNSNLPDAGKTFSSSRRKWKKFWKTGGAIDLSESLDSRAHELERRIVLSRYLTAVQCAGSMPPQETGLTFNSWYGKSHLEMHWWHGVHFVLWNKPELLEKSMSFYKKILPNAVEYAHRQGYEGARWQKMVGPEARDEGPSTVGVFLIWQQPNPIYFAELLYRYYNDSEILQQYSEIVFETADFMASYAHWDELRKRYVLGPPLIPAQEIFDPEIAMNPAFELAYWNFGLRTAQKWRERQGLKRNEKWDHVLKHLSRLPENSGLYRNAENDLNTFTNSKSRKDHPTLLAPFGMLPGVFDDNGRNMVDSDKMRKTLKSVMESWSWSDTWGWDYPMIAMTAARLGEPEIAIEALLLNVQKNRYLNNGHNYQDDNLTIYLPGNGGFLTAVAMMAAGWEGASNVRAPGFPQNKDWVVKYEGLRPMM